MHFGVNELKEKCAGFLDLSAEAIEKLELYGNLLLEWNEKINLTAITEPEEILYKHFYDCLLFFEAVNVPENASIIDVGTGAGFPGMVLKIARPDIRLTLLDSLGKRVTFLRELANTLSLYVNTLHLRAEDGGQDKTLREQFDISCARAVANLNVLSEYCVPFVKTGGIFVAMKGKSAEDELATAKEALTTLGCSDFKVIHKTLRKNEERSFIISKKTSQTPPKYPRNSAKIAKAVLK